MLLNVRDTLITTKRLKLGAEGWFVTNVKTPVQADEVKLGAILQLERIYWTDGPYFDPDCAICFTEIGSTVGGPEFSSSELHQFLKDEILVKE